MRIGIILFLVLISILFYYESEHLIYYISCIGNSKNRSGLPTPKICKDRVKSLLKNFNNNYMLIDFGCGDGDAIQSFYPYVENAIGIEINENQVISARKRFINRPSVSIVHSNIVYYKFMYTPTILYMYEPLWSMKKEEALSIYDSVVTAFRKQTDPESVIIYVSGMLPLLDTDFFTKRLYTKKHHSRIPRILGWPGNHVYVFSVN